MEDDKREVNEKESLENKTLGTKILLGLVGVCILTLGGFCTNLYLEHKSQEREIKRNLAPNAVYFGKKPSKYSMHKSSILYNEDLNKDGKYESVLEFKINEQNKDNVYYRLVEKKNQEINLRKFKVVTKSIFDIGGKEPKTIYSKSEIEYID
jgi:hypothetical protein